MRKSFIGMILAVSVVVGVTTPVAARDQQCGQLEALGAKYAGLKLKLTPDQETLKEKLTAWYMTNCRAATASASNNPK
jgi:hypothetical protein